MDVLDRKTTEELLRAILAEAAKANNELRCSLHDVQKAQNRLNFMLVLINRLIERTGD